MAFQHELIPVPAFVLDLDCCDDSLKLWVVAEVQLLPGVLYSGEAGGRFVVLLHGSITSLQLGVKVEKRELGTLAIVYNIKNLLQVGDELVAVPVAVFHRDDLEPKPASILPSPELKEESLVFGLGHEGLKDTVEDGIVTFIGQTKNRHCGP